MKSIPAPEADGVIPRILYPEPDPKGNPNPNPNQSLDSTRGLLSRFQLPLRPHITTVEERDP